MVLTPRLPVPGLLYTSHQPGSAVPSARPISADLLWTPFASHGTCPSLRLLQPISTLPQQDRADASALHRERESKPFTWVEGACAADGEEPACFRRRRGIGAKSGRRAVECVAREHVRETQTPERGARRRRGRGALCQREHPVASKSCKFIFSQKIPKRTCGCWRGKSYE